MSKIILSESQKTAIKEHTLSCFPKEACGVITVDSYIPLENVSPNPHFSFEIKKEDFNKVAEEAIAIYHSHTRLPGEYYELVKSYDARTPSKKDVQSCNALGIPFFISATDGETVMECIQFPQSPEEELFHRPFIFYINDCYTLVRDYLFQKHGIKLDGHHDTFDWFNDGKGIVYPFYDAYYEEWGFKEISEDELEEGDVVIMSFGGTANHLGIYVGDYNILHHAVNQVPAVMSMSRLKSYIHRYLRHKDK
jgi:hypothetical protein